MVNMVDTEKLMKSMITQFCEQNLKFSANLQILGSVHIIADNIEVLTCLLNEKYFKSPHTRALIPQTPHQAVISATSVNNPALNLVTTLNHMHQHHQHQLKVHNTLNGGDSLNGKSSSLGSSSSSSSHSSSSSTYSSSSSTSNSKHKRKRFTPRSISGADDDSAIASANPSSNPPTHTTTTMSIDDGVSSTASVQAWVMPID